MRILLIVFGAMAVVLVAALKPVPGPGPAAACTGGPGPLEWSVFDAKAIAVLEVLSAGGPEITAPTVTPTPVSTPRPNLRPPGTLPTPRIPNLEGIGAHLKVERVITGSLPVEIDLDAATRRRMEELIRRVQGNPDTILPCAIDFLAERYRPGQRFLLFLASEDGEYYTWQRWRMDGNLILTAGANVNSAETPLFVSKKLRDAYFSTLPSQAWGEPAEGKQQYFLITAERVPLETMVTAVHGIQAAGTLTPEPESTLSAIVSQQPGSTPTTAAPGLIRPPDTGDAGLH